MSRETRSVVDNSAQPCALQQHGLATRWLRQELTNKTNSSEDRSSGREIPASTVGCGYETVTVQDGSGGFSVHRWRFSCSLPPRSAHSKPFPLFSNEPIKGADGATASLTSSCHKHQEPQKRSEPSEEATDTTRFCRKTLWFLIHLCGIRTFH